MKTRNALGILSSELATGNLLWVDPVNGIDALAARGRMTIPFKTLTAAKNAAKAAEDGSGLLTDTIIVLPGGYSDTDLAKNGVSWHFLPGAIVSGSGGTALFNVTSSAMRFGITGWGVLNSGGATNLLNVNASNALIQVRFSKGDGKIQIAQCLEVLVEADEITGDTVPTIDVTGGTLLLRIRKVVNDSADAVHMTGGTLDVEAFTIFSSSGNGIFFGGGTAKITAFEIRSAGNDAVECDAYDGICRIRGARLVSAAGRAASVTNGDEKLSLKNCTLISSSSPSIQASNSNTTVLLEGHCVGNYDKGNLIDFKPTDASLWAFNSALT